MTELAGWRNVHIGFEGDRLAINGLIIWQVAWRATEEPAVELPHPAYPEQRHRFDIYEAGDSALLVRFAAGELSNGVWGFYVPA